MNFKCFCIFKSQLSNQIQIKQQNHPNSKQQNQTILKQNDILTSAIQLIQIKQNNQSPSIILPQSSILYSLFSIHFRIINGKKLQSFCVEMQTNHLHDIGQIKLLPLKLVAAFEKTLNVKDIMFTLHKIIKHSFEYKASIGFNLDTYLNLDKCRKVAQLKEDTFIKQVSDKINDYHRFINSQTETLPNSPQPTLTELAKFTELFYQRKSQVTYLQTIVEKISSSLEFDEKQQNKNSNTLHKMKNILQEIQQKLIIVIDKIQHHISVGDNPHHHNPNRQTPHLHSNHARRRSSANRAKTVIVKVQNPTQLKVENNKNQEIQKLKAQYRRLNCKQSKIKVEKIQRKAKRQASVVKFCTEPYDVDGAVPKVNNGHNPQGPKISQVINPTFQKDKISKHNTYLSKFVKSTKSNSMVNLPTDQILKIYAQKRKKLEIKGEKKKMNTFTKKPSAQSLFDNLTKSNPAQSFYISNNFPNEQNKTKQFQNRASTAKLVRHSMKTLYDKQQKFKSSLKRFSRRQSRDLTIKKHLVQQSPRTADIACADGANILSGQFKPKTIQKITSSFQIKEELYDQKEQDETVELRQIMNGRQRGLRKKSRMRGFSKTNMGSGDDTQGESPEKALLATMESNVQKDTIDHEIKLEEQESQPGNSLSPNRNRLKKRGTNESLSMSKLVYKNILEVFQQIGANEDKNGAQGQNVVHPTKKHAKVRKFIRGNENAVNLSQCALLCQQITQQWKQDKEKLFGRGFQIMIRKKYDKDYKPQNKYDNKDDLEFGESCGVRKKATDSNLTESEATVDSYRRQKWGYEELDQAGINNALTRKLGELGQKSMQAKSRNDNKEGQQQQLETLYI